jgi:hypothetical protein
MKTILARVTRNVKEDPSIPKTNIWNVETVFLEKLPAEEVSLVPDPKKTGVEQIPGSKLDSTRSVFTIRTRGRSPLKECDTIQAGVSEIAHKSFRICEQSRLTAFTSGQAASPIRAGQKIFIRLICLRVDN